MNDMEKRLLRHILSLMNSYEDKDRDVIELLEILLESDNDD